MTRKADKSALEGLHNTLADKLSELLDGVDMETKGAAAILNVARQFLNDNGITADAVPGSPLGKLKEDVTRYPFDPAEDARH